jgi:pfkB family carbohydrate kinase
MLGAVEPENRGGPDWQEQAMLVVCGEALMDVFVAGETATGVALDARVGGSPFNVALGLARLAQPVAFFGALSGGPLGERLLRSLTEEGVNTACIVRTDAPTTLGLVGLDAAGVPACSCCRRRWRAFRHRRGPSTSVRTQRWSSRSPPRCARWSSARRVAA